MRITACTLSCRHAPPAQRPPPSGSPLARPRRHAAARSGAYSLSSNRIHDDGSCGGVGWVISPDGELLARTSPEQPARTVDLDLAAAAAAKASYPRYVFREPADPLESAELSRQR
jgi:predicted amidohydrolase